MVWTLNQISWHDFCPDLVDNNILKVIKTASLIEANSADYVKYLHNVFSENESFTKAVTVWGEEEHNHGLALGHWAEMADSDFNFAKSLEYFRQGYQIPFNDLVSVRGSQVGELMARCVVEAGTSSFYSAIRDHVKEPCLKQICHHIAQDEFAHYNLFRTTIMKNYKEEYDQIPFWQKMKISIGRMQEADDDEISFAYYSATSGPPNQSTKTYDVKECGNAYFSHIYKLYQRKHIKILIRMVTRIIGLNPNGILVKICNSISWRILQWKK